MGIFKDFATSGYGDVTIGALDGLNQVAQRDAVFNAGVAESSLNKYNAEFANTELAFKNRDQLELYRGFWVTRGGGAHLAGLSHLLLV